MNGLSNEEGYTLLEVLVTLSITSICLFLFSIAITQIKTVRTTVKDDRQIEWHLFLNTMEYDLIDTEFIEVKNTSLSFDKYNEKTKGMARLTYRVGRNEIVRSFSNGNEPILTELSKAEYEMYSTNRVRLKVTFNNGEDYTAYIKVNEGIP